MLIPLIPFKKSFNFLCPFCQSPFKCHIDRLTPCKLTAQECKCKNFCLTISALEIYSYDKKVPISLQIKRLFSPLKIIKSIYFGQEEEYWIKIGYGRAKIYKWEDDHYISILTTNKLSFTDLRQLYKYDLLK